MRQRWYERQLELGRDPRGHRAGARATPASSRGTTLPGEPAAPGLPAAGGVRRVPRPHRRPDRPARRRASARIGELDNTILVVLADNGASQEGGPFGVMHEMKFFNGILETPDEAIDRIDDIGGPHSHTNYPWGWAQCGNTPFKWYKQNTHEGGVHVPMIVHWPAGIARRRSGHEARPVRERLRHRARPSTSCSASRRPTRVPRPRAAAGHRPLLRRASSPTRTAPAANRCSTSRWPAAAPSSPASGRRCASTSRAPTTTPSRGSCTTSPSTARSATTSPPTEPERAGRADRLWWAEAERHGVLPLDDRMHRAVRRPLPGPLAAPDRPPLRATGRRCRRSPARPSAAIGGRSFDLTARVTVDGRRRGRLWATGTRELGPLGVRAGRPPGGRLQRVRRPHRRRVRRRGARRRRRADRPLPPRRAWPGSRRAGRRRHRRRPGRPPAVHAHDLVGRLQRRRRPRLGRCRPATRRRSRSPARCTRSSSSSSRQPAAEPTPPQNAPNGPPMTLTVTLLGTGSPMPGADRAGPAC